MKSEWTRVPLSRVAEVQTGPFGSQLHNQDYVTEGTPIVTVEHLGSRSFTTQNLPCVSEEDRSRLSKYSLNTGDIVFSRVGSVDRCSYVNEANAGWLFSGRCLRVRSTNIHPEFLYYFFCQEQVKEYVKSIAVGATMPSINTKLLNDVEVILPPLPIQRKIASILSALDDKIETNNAICRNLEEQARALYELWLSKRKNECEWLSLEAIADLNPEAYSIKEKWGYINYLDTGNITDGVISSIQKIDLEQDELPSRARRKVKAGDVVFSTVRPNQRHFGILHSPLPNMLVSTGFTVIRSNKTDISNELIYLLLSDSTFVEKMQQIGEQSVSAYPSVKPTDIATCQIPFMDSMDYFQMQKVICSMFSQSAVLKDVNRYLEDMRDTLLPKLMDGEIDLGKLGKLA